jgi:predicted SAM-dependent methyltransferase
VIKLNFGCGNRFARGWVNIDFHSVSSEVQRVNLLQRWPFPDSYFDCAYSSHTLEHFSPDTAERLLIECARVMKAGGITRTVVPDLESTCREYLRILDQVNSSELARRQYDWIILELLDQMTRTKPSGRMAGYRERLLAANDQEMIRYVKSRTDTNPWESASKSLGQKLSSMTPGQVANKLIYWYVGGVKKLLPGSLRDAIIDDTRIGEKHKWMYDRYNLAALMRRCGFLDVTFRTSKESAIPDFGEDFLDINPDGSVYKPFSLYCEAKKG